MVPVNRPARQAVATLVLFGLTVVPTAWVVAIAWRINRPGHVRDVEVELGHRLGLHVTLDSVRYPRPGEAVYRGVVLRHDEPRGGALAELARIDEIRVSRSGRELTLHLENPRLHAASPALALEGIAARLQAPGPAAYDRVNVAAPTCEVDLGGEGLRFSVREVAGGVQAAPEGTTVRLAYRMPAAATGSRAARDARFASAAGTHCELILAHDRRPATPETSLAFRTVEGLPVPAGALAPFFDADDWLGPQATVDGELKLARAGRNDWEIQFAGSLHEIELTRLVGRRFPRHRLSGRARLAIASARWGQRPGQGPGWIALRGELVAGQGSIGGSLLDALAHEMSFRLSPRVTARDRSRADLDFRALGLAFDVRPGGEIHLAGALGAEFPPDVVLAGPTSPLASAPAGTANVHGLIKTLFPVADARPGELIPLTPGSRVLLSLPAPADAGRGGRRLPVGN